MGFLTLIKGKPSGWGLVIGSFLINIGDDRVMKDYVVYECMICKLVFAIPLEHLRIAEDKGRYLACNFGHKQIKILNEYDSLKECMSNHVYKRDKGVIKQIK